MSDTKTALLRVPGASLHYKIRGAGPILVFLQGGRGDAEGFDGVANRLVEHYTVVSCDRRGLSRSKPDDPGEVVTLRTHSEDVHHLLAALTPEPAFVFGSSIGALIGIDLICRYPRQVRALIAHEPPAPELLPEPDRARAVLDQVAAEEAFQRGGVAAAMRRFLEFTGMTPADREPDLERPPPGPWDGPNTAFFLTHDAPAVRLYRVDFRALEAAAARIVPAAGSSNRAYWVHHTAEGLAALTGATLQEFPGGHAGFGSHPKGFAAKLQEVLAALAARGL